MGYKWRPSKSQRRAFAIKMQDPEEKAAYEKRKEQKAQKRRETSSFNYSKAGGNYVPTKEQSDFAINHMDLFITPEEIDAANFVISGYECNEKIHHDFIHIVNEKRRKFTYV